MYSFANGDTFSGEFKKDTMNGLGRIDYSDGSSYYGNFEKDKRKGFGLYIMIDSKRNQRRMLSSGVWKDDRLEGEVSLIFPEFPTITLNACFSNNLISGEVIYSVVETP